MAFEIERKFLVNSTDYRDMASSHSRIRQGYICRESGRTVRIRIRDGRGFLTIKGPSPNGISRYEFEKEISLDEAEHLFELCQPGVIDKTRYLVPMTDGHVFEVDEFYGDNEGLTMAEVELSSVDESFEKPDFIGRDVTGDRRFYNSSLRVNPFKDWKDMLPEYKK